MSEHGLREHMRLNCSNPGVHAETLLEMLASERARADALEAAIVAVLGDHDHGTEDQIECHTLLERALAGDDDAATAPQEGE